MTEVIKIISTILKLKMHAKSFFVYLKSVADKLKPFCFGEEKKQTTMWVQLQRISSLVSRSVSGSSKVFYTFSNTSEKCYELIDLIRFIFMKQIKSLTAIIPYLTMYTETRYGKFLLQILQDSSAEIVPRRQQRCGWVWNVLLSVYMFSTQVEIFCSALLWVTSSPLNT